MQEKKRPFFPSMKLVAVAALAGIAAGGLAVYMKETSKGNDAVAEIDCAPAAETIARIAPFAKGEVAAFITEKQGRALVLPPVKNGEGKAVTLADFGNRIQLVNLWATWCVPCREEMPALNELEKTLGGEQFQVTTINLDTGDDEKPREFLEENAIDALPLLHDPSLSTFNALKKAGLAFGLPASVLVDGRGCMLGAMNGPAEWASDDAKALVKAAIGT